MTLQQRIRSILNDAALENGVAEQSRTEAIEALIDEHGWPKVRDGVLDILWNDSQASHWHTAAEVLWGAVLDNRDLPIDTVIALLYYRFDPDGTKEDNLVWSITSKLKNVGYLSRYKPLNDPAVVKELTRISGAV